MIKKLIPFAIITASLFISCGGGSINREVAPPIEYSVEELDSIGRAFAPEVGVYGGTLTIPLGANPDGFCPQLSNSAYSSAITGYIFEGLIKTDPVTMKQVPHLARSWEVCSNATRWQFNLRTDILFSDGQPLTSADVLFTFEDVIFNPALGSPLAVNFTIDGKPIQLEAPDDSTVIFTLAKPFAPFLTIAGTPILPKHLYETPAKEGRLRSFLSSNAPVERVVGTGPFILHSISLGRGATLKRNPIYWQRDAEGNRLPYLDQIHLPIVSDPNVMLTKFQSGELDHIVLPGDQYPLLKPREEELNIEIFRVGPRWVNRFIKFNMNNQVDENGVPFVPLHKQALLRNRRFRQAIAYSIDYDEIIRIIFNGLAYPPTGVYGEAHGRWHNPNARRYYFNEEKADSLFDYIGLERGADGLRRDSSGRVVQLTYNATADVRMIENIATMIRTDLAKRGLRVHINLVEFNTLISKVEQTYDWDLISFGLSIVPDPHFGRSSYTPNTPRYYSNPQRFDSNRDPIPKNNEPWEERIEEIFEEASTEMDDEKRIALYREWLEIEQEECTMVLLPNQEVILGIQNRFGNIQLHGNLNLTESLLSNIEHIYVREKK